MINLDVNIINQQYLIKYNSILNKLLINTHYINKNQLILNSKNVGINSNIKIRAFMFLQEEYNNWWKWNNNVILKIKKENNK